MGRSDNITVNVQQPPCFAIIGHPNEGKSSVLSTLAEDDSVRVSPIPGETTHCQAFPVVIDGREVIRFIDTPGFQNPRQTLSWMQSYQGPENLLVPAFLTSHTDNPEFQDDCQLLQPVAEGAGIIFVVDGSRPVRNVDRAEMEILRLTGAPRMAVINNKEDDADFIADWQNAFRKHFNAIRIFNSCRANYIERIALLESLKSIDQQLEPLLQEVISAFKQDWALRTERSAQLIVDLLCEVFLHKDAMTVQDSHSEEELHARLLERYQHHISATEQRTHAAMRKLFKHNIFNVALPQHSILKEDLFSKKTWEFLGLNKSQLITAGALSGAVVGGSIDAMIGGASFGIGAAIGGVMGAAGTAFKGKQLIDQVKLFGLKVGGEQLQIGPPSNSQLMFILLDRSLLFYRHIINWAHGRRDYEEYQSLDPDKIQQGYTSRWNSQERHCAIELFKAITKEDEQKIITSSNNLRAFLIKQLSLISRH